MTACLLFSEHLPIFLQQRVPHHFLSVQVFNVWTGRLFHGSVQSRIADQFFHRRLKRSSILYRHDQSIFLRSNYFVTPIDIRDNGRQFHCAGLQHHVRKTFSVTRKNQCIADIILPDTGRIGTIAFLYPASYLPRFYRGRQICFEK